jgi:hypothetical protein
MRIAMNRSIALTMGAIAVTVALGHAALAQGALQTEKIMARGGLLGVLALPVPILLLLMWALGWLH